MSATLHPHATRPETDETRRETNRLDNIGWGLFLVMTGGLLLFSSIVPSGTWLVATGILLLALNAVRHFRGLGFSLFTLILGALALAAGLADLAHVGFPIFAVALVAFGIAVLVKPMPKQRE
ncbi:MAG TPA: hypothetical protein VFJ20_11075 [Gemmatimonadaceae bacterium]|nr:hypothetical protein [Gemmatimonadaceae bacterium]